jgi:PIN domain nuclease of toxin-antitoxin system
VQYLADTVAIIRHFAKVGRIGKAAKQILRDADKGQKTILISIISMVEVLYLSERNKIPLNFEKVKRKLKNLHNYRIVNLDLDIVETATPWPLHSCPACPACPVGKLVPGLNACPVKCVAYLTGEPPYLTGVAPGNGTGVDPV